MPTVISFANMKGGVGKTTLCVNLAFELFGRSNRVLVVDNDPQFNATSALLEPKDYIEKCIKEEKVKTIYNIYQKPPRIGSKRPRKSNPSDCIINTWSHWKDPHITLDLIPSRIELHETLLNPASKELLLDRFLQNHARKYDYILIDCPPTPSVLTRSAFGASDYVIIPVKPDFFSTLGLPQFIGTLEDFKETCHDPHEVRLLGVVFTDVNRRHPEDTDNAMQRVRDTLLEFAPDLPVFAACLSHLEVFKKTLWQAVPVQEISGRGTRGKSEATRELHAIADELLRCIEGIRKGGTV